MTKQRVDDYGGKEYCQKIGKAIVELAHAMEGHRELSVEPTGLSVRGPRFRGGEYLVVIKGLDEEGLPLVAFHSALDMGEVIRGVESRLRNGSLKWRKDEYLT